MADLPKGPSGKVQRLKLVETAAALMTSGPSEYQEAGMTPAKPAGAVDSAATSIEQTIAQIWSDLLGVRDIGVDANFFSLGGHSLMAIQCLSLLRQQLRTALSLSDFFENASIRQLAALARRRLPPEGAATAEAGSTWEMDLLAGLGPPAIDDAIPRRDPAQKLTLSPDQRRIWFMEQLAPEEPVYNESDAVRLRGALDVDLLKRALDAVVARHETLRTIYPLAGDEPAPVVLGAWRALLKTIDLSEMPASEREAELEHLLVSEPREPYRLANEPGVRVTLVRLREADHALIVMMHHIVCDYASIGILWREVSAHYGAGLRGKTAELPSLPIQYGDYAVWQNQVDVQRNWEADFDYWKQKLEGAPVLLDLPADRPRPPNFTFRGARRRFLIEPEKTAALRDFGRRRQISLFNIFAAAVSVLLHRYSGQDEIVLGLPLSQRDRPDLQSVFGFFLHTHVLRTQLSADMPFADLLATVQKGTLDLYAHRSLPFDEVVRAAQPPRSASYSPLFQVMLNWRDKDQLLSFIGLEGLEVECLVSEAATAKFDLTFALTDVGDVFWVDVEYCTDLFEEARIERMVGHLITILEGVTTNPEQAIGVAPMLTPAERQQLLMEWNRKEVAYRRDRSLHELIEEQVERTPEAVAVVFEGEQLTYRQLNERANQLARHLQELGVGPDTLVCICVERSLEMVIGLLGILKAAGAYVPLDPAYPKERLAFMLADAGSPVLLTHSGLEGSLPAYSGKVVRLDADWPRIAQEDVGNVASAVKSNHLSYMIYTSGSTGHPKGALIEHGALVQHCVECQQFYGLTSKDRVLQFASLSFDAAIEQILPPLLSGACVVLREATVWAPDDFQRKLEELGLTVINLPPAYWHQLAEGWANSVEPISAHQLRLVIIGGDAMSVQSLRLWQQTPLNGVRLVNAYGPTEAVITATSYEIPSGWGRTPLEKSPLAVREALAKSTCLIGGANRCRWGWQANCTSGGPRWPAVITTGRS